MKTILTFIPKNDSIIDRLIESARKYDYELETVSNNFNRNYSQVLNNCLEESKNYLFLNPWEYIISPPQKTDNLCYVSIIDGEIISKEIRIFPGTCKFANPVYPIIDSSTNNLSCCVIGSSSTNFRYDPNLVYEWRAKEPLNPKPLYYQAISLLQQGKYKDFLTTSSQYMRMNPSISISGTMNKYYYALVSFTVNKDYKSAIQNLIQCLSINICMAEFWCLLGDIYYELNDYNKAIDFYQNALLLGSRRLRNDKWPMIVSKYEEYPQNMIKSCLKLTENNHFILPLTDDA